MTSPASIVAEIDTALSAEARKKIPNLKNAREFSRGDVGRAACAAPGSRILIRFSLTCDHDHEFEAWFRSNDDFETPEEARLRRMPDLRLDEGREGADGARRLDRPQARKDRARHGRDAEEGDGRAEGAVGEDARERRLCRRQVRRGSAQDPFRRDRCARHLWRGDARRGEEPGRGRRRSSCRSRCSPRTGTERCQVAGICPLAGTFGAADVPLSVLARTE